MLERARRVIADTMMRAACALIGWADWLDPAPKLPGCDERMWAGVVDRLGTDAQRGKRDGRER